MFSKAGKKPKKPTGNIASKRQHIVRLAGYLHEQEKYIHKPQFGFRNTR